MAPLSTYLLRLVIRPCLAIIPFLVLLVVKGYTYSPYVAARSIAFRVLTEALFIAWVILAIREPHYRPRKNPLFIAFLGFLTIQLISAIFGEDFGKSFWGTLLHMEGLVTYLHLFAYIVVLSSILNSHEQWKHHFNLHLAAGFFWAGFCIVEWLTGDRGYRVESLLGNSIYAATYSYFMIFISGMLLTQKRRETARVDLSRIGYIISIILHIVIIILTGTRGALLGLFVSFVAMTGLAMVLLRTNRPVRRLSAVSLSLIMLAGIALLAFRDSAAIKEAPILARLASTTSEQSSVKARLISWRAALEGAKERPVLGWGMGNFHLVMSKYYDPLLYDHAQWFDRAHNVFLDWLIASGVPGFLSYLFLLGGIFWLIWRGQHRLPLELKIILTGLLTGYLAQLVFGFDSIMSLILWGTIAAFAASKINDTRQVRTQSAAGKPNRTLALRIFSGYVVATIAISFFMNYSVLRHSVLLTKARWYNSPEGPSENIEIFQGLLHPRTFAQPEVTEELFNFVTAAVNGNNANPQKRLEYLSMVTREFDAEIERKPLDPRVLWFAARTRIEMGDFYQAIIYMRKAKTLAPRMPILLSTLAQAYFLSNDYLNTEKELEYLYSLAPTNAQAKAAYIQILQLNGKNAEAELVARK